MFSDTTLQVHVLQNEKTAAMLVDGTQVVKLRSGKANVWEPSMTLAYAVCHASAHVPDLDLVYCINLSVTFILARKTTSYFITLPATLLDTLA